MSSMPRNIDFDRKEGGFPFYLLPLVFFSWTLSKRNLPIDNERHFRTNVILKCVLFQSAIKQNTDKID